MITKHIMSSLSLLFVSACAMAPSAEFVGETYASPTLRADVYNMVSLVTSAKGCSSIDKVDTYILEAPTGEAGLEQTKEIWIVHGCQTTYPYEITLRGDGQGGSYFIVSTAK